MSPIDANNYGGAIYDAGGLVIQASRIANNYAYSSGGGISVAGCDTRGCVSGNVDIQTSILSNNTANAADSTMGGNGGGGGIFVDARSDNFGIIGSIDNSTFTYNSTLGFGAGINNQGIAANIFNTTFSYNLNCTPIPGAGECAQGDPTTAGGAIYNDASAILLQVTQCTFYGNRALQGAGIYNEASDLSPGRFDDIPVEATGVYIPLCH